MIEQDDFLTQEWIRNFDKFVKDLTEPTSGGNEKQESEDPHKAYERAMDIVR